MNQAVPVALDQVGGVARDPFARGGPPQILTYLGSGEYPGAPQQILPPVTHGTHPPPPP